jgi:predicted secreted protein
MLHKETFLKQVSHPHLCSVQVNNSNKYNKHWNDPTKTRIIWVGMLFSILCLAMQSYSRNNEVPPEYQGTAPAITELYRIRTAQCLVIADITRPTEFMIETLNMYSQIEYSDQRDGDMGVYMLAGMMMRMALQQGYHRDPSLHRNISIFQGEMRRRIWSGVSQHDLLFSVQIGLPKAIRYSECDTELPRNIHEEELYEDMKELPPSRPLTEETEVSYQWFVLSNTSPRVTLLSSFTPVFCSEAQS